MTFKKKRLAIKKLVELGHVDRWEGRLKITGSEISIGKDTGALSRGPAVIGRSIHSPINIAN
jgi:hypothetical protein